MKTIKKAQKGTKVAKTNVIKSSGPKSGSGNPFTGPSSPAQKSAFTETDKKRMKADAEGTFAPLSSKTRILPEMKGPVSVKTPTTKKPTIKKREGSKVITPKAKYGATTVSNKKMMYGGEMDMAKKGASIKKRLAEKCKMGC